MTQADRTTPPEPRFLTDPDPERILQVGELRIDVGAVSVTAHGQRVELTLKEFEVLLALADHAGRVVTSHDLVQRVWGAGYQDVHGNLKAYVMRLRNRMRTAIGKDCIRTVRGLGYVLEP